MGFAFLILLILCVGPFFVLVCRSQGANYRSDYLKPRVRPANPKIFR
jgi:hypothetical protein